MADYFTFSGDGGSIAPHRPGLTDVGGGAWEDDQEYPPDPQTMPAAEDANQIAKLACYVWNVVPVARISITFSAGTPQIAYFGAVNPNLTSGSIVLTDNGNGDTSITWPANTFPSKNLNPSGLTLVEDVEIDRARAYPITNGIRVKTKLAAVGTDCAFTVDINGQ